MATPTRCRAESMFRQIALAMGTLSQSSFEQSKQLLIEVLHGKTCLQVAAAAGLGRSAVDKRVKHLVQRIDSAVGIDGMDDDGLLSLIRLRARREEVMTALARFDPAVVARPADAPLTVQQLHESVVKIRARSDNALRDIALFYCLFATGAKPIEIARLEVGDYLNPDGSVRRSSEMRAAVAASGTARVLYWRSPFLCDALDAYLAKRVARGHGTAHGSQYRGLNPASRLFLTEAGDAFEVSTRHTSGRGKSQCWGIHKVFRALLRRGGLKGMTPLAARRTFALRLRELGADDAEIGELVGVKDARALRALFGAGRRSLHDIAADVL